MALQTATFLQLQNAVKHALGKTPDSTTSLAEIVNDALQAFCNLHPWTWLEASTTLSLTASQAYVALPADFFTLKTIQILSTNGFQLEPATLERINDLRADTTASPVAGLYLYAITWQTQASVTASPTARLELWPTPAASASNVLRVWYRRGIRALSGSTDLPDIPPMCHMALKKYVRAWALEDDGQDGAEKEMAAAMLQVAALIKLDGIVKPSFGIPRPGVMLPGRPTTSIRPGDSISLS